jgi:hypothetical protein
MEQTVGEILKDEHCARHRERIQLCRKSEAEKADWRIHPIRSQTLMP